MATIRLPLLALAIVAVASAGCATLPRVREPVPEPAWAADLDRADQFVRSGCYNCLSEAARIYRHVAEASPHPRDASRRLIDTLVLMAARERELGLARATALEQAHAAASDLPVPMDYGLYLDVVRSTGWNPAGGTRAPSDAALGELPNVNRSWQAWRARLAAAAGTDLLSQYLLFSFDCTNENRLRAAGLAAWTPPASAPPLLRYRQATCDALDGPALDALLLSVPAFAEAHLHLGQIALDSRKLLTAERHFEQAIAGLPSLTPALVQLGFVYLAMEDIEASWDAYHRAVAMAPDHRPALLGEARTLSYLGRHDEAIAVLDHMVALGTWYMGEAHYWRGWNRHRLRQYEAADEDVAASRSRLPMDPLVDKLAGQVALARQDIGRAEREFRLAVEHFDGRGQRDCEAGYYLASTLAMQRKWAEAGPFFEKSVPCYVQDEAGARARIAEIEASDLPEARKARLTAAKRREMAGHVLQQARASFNAAAAWTNLGQPDKARPFAERAAAHPDMAEQANALLARIR